MKVNRLILREITHRKLNFFLSLIAVVFAVFCVASTVALFRAFDLHTEKVVADMQAATKINLKTLEDDIRKSMKGLGFNIYIFPEGQDMSEVYEKGYASKTMPEEYVKRLAESKIVTVNHLLPTLTRQVKWPERERTVILIGTKGEVPLAHRDPKKPLLDQVQAGHMVMGYELHKSLGLKVGDSVTFMGHELVIDVAHPERGSKDDITLWVNLHEAQAWLDQAGRINAIQALECNCATIDRLGEIRAELLAILPGTKIIETESTALARAEARVKTEQAAKRELAAVQARRDQQKAEREQLASVLLPLILVFCIGLMALLTFMNVRERLPEIGILRAIGVKSGVILWSFMARAFIAGIIGVALAMLVTVGLAGVVKEGYLHGFALRSLFTREELVLLILLAPLLSGLAAWLPSLQAAQKDPATVLHRD
ncbi:MAG: putative ABC transport system permease protein [Candidatus Omnitrophota bacterium]|jgi:putative ABC transport system permease protein